MPLHTARLQLAVSGTQARLVAHSTSPAQLAAWLLVLCWPEDDDAGLQVHAAPAAAPPAEQASSDHTGDYDRLMARFKAADLDGNGVIDKSELKVCEMAEQICS